MLTYMIISVVIIFALHLAVFYLSFPRESIWGFLKVYEVYVVLIVTVERVSANSLAILDLIKILRKGGLGLLCQWTTLSPVKPWNSCLVPSPFSGSQKFFQGMSETSTMMSWGPNLSLTAPDWWPHRRVVWEVVKSMWVWSCGEEGNIKTTAFL